MYDMKLNCVTNIFIFTDKTLTLRYHSFIVQDICKNKKATLFSMKSDGITIPEYSYKTKIEYQFYQNGYFISCSKVKILMKVGNFTNLCSNSLFHIRIN